MGEAQVALQGSEEVTVRLVHEAQCVSLQAGWEALFCPAEKGNHRSHSSRGGSVSRGAHHICRELQSHRMARNLLCMPCPRACTCADCQAEYRG